MEAATILFSQLAHHQQSATFQSAIILQSITTLANVKMYLIHIQRNIAVWFLVTTSKHIANMFHSIILKHIADMNQSIIAHKSAQQESNITMTNIAHTNHIIATKSNHAMTTAAVLVNNALINRTSERYGFFFDLMSFPVFSVVYLLIPSFIFNRLVEQ